MTSQCLWCASAWLPGGPAARVRVHIRGERITRVEPGVPPRPGDEVREGMLLPGAANCHSHTFHRALRGAGVPGGSFWTWREDMYRIAGRLTPESYHELALGAYAEMLEAGYTSVGEFHYLHHRPDGTPHPDPNAMGEALISAAEETGIRLTLLDTCYLSSGFGASLTPDQLRFGDGDATAWAERVDALAAAHPDPAHSARWGSTGTTGVVGAGVRTGPGVRIGAAIHSVRAVPPRDMAIVASWARDRGAPLHVHLSEQVAENEACLEALGATPTAVLEGAGAWEAHATAVHATHLEAADIAVLGAHRVTCCLCPSTEADLADGIGPAVELAGSGAPLALGSDQNVLTDPFAEMRRLEMDQRLARGTRENFTPVALVDALTVDGHACLGWPESGRIREGALADLVHVSTTSAAVAGVRPDRIPLQAGAHDVTDVWVGGRRVVGAGRHVGVEAAPTLARCIAALRSTP